LVLGCHAKLPNERMQEDLMTTLNQHMAVADQHRTLETEHVAVDYECKDALN